MHGGHSSICVYQEVGEIKARYNACSGMTALPHIWSWMAIVLPVHSLTLQVVSEAAINHIWKNDVRKSFRSIKAHSKELHNVGVVKITHHSAFIKQSF